MKVGYFVRQMWAVQWLLVVVLLTGCGKAGQPWETAYPAEGVVKFGGQPLGGAQVTLIPEDSSIPDTVRPRGFTRPDGTFELSTYAENDGAPEGKYKVIAMRFPVRGTPESPSQGPNDLPVKYSKPETTDLQVEVTAPETVLKTLELQP